MAMPGVLKNSLRNLPQSEHGNVEAVLLEAVESPDLRRELYIFSKSLESDIALNSMSCRECKHDRETKR